MAIPNPFSIGGPMGVPTNTGFGQLGIAMPMIQQVVPSSAPTPPNGGDLPGFRHGSGAASVSARNAARFGGPMGLTPPSSPGPGRRRRERSRDRNRMDDEEDAEVQRRARSQPVRRAGVQTALELEDIVMKQDERMDTLSGRIARLEGQANRNAPIIAEAVMAIPEIKQELDLLKTKLESMVENTNVLTDRLNNGGTRVENSINELRGMIMSLRSMMPTQEAQQDPMKTRAPAAAPDPVKAHIGTNGASFSPEQDNQPPSPWFGSPENQNRGQGGKGGNGGDANYQTNYQAGGAPTVQVQSFQNWKIQRKKYA